MNINIIEALQMHAEERAAVNNTVYFLKNRIIYPDEIFSTIGFLPLIARVAQKAARRLLDADTLSECGFVYSPYKDAGILPDNMRLLFLRNASVSVVGMDFAGALDLTPIHDFFMEIRQEERSARLEKLDDSQWPLYRPVQVS